VLKIQEQTFIFAKMETKKKQRVRPQAKKKKKAGTEVSWLGISLVFFGLIAAVFLFRGLHSYLSEPGRFAYLNHLFSIVSHRNTIETLKMDGYSIYGIDLSHHQDKIDWPSLREQEVTFAFIKASEGVNMQDRHFKKHWQGAKSQQILRGAYHFFLPVRSAREQADNFISQVKLEEGDLPPVLDVEVTNHKSSEEIREGVQEWLNLVEAHYKVRPIIYTGNHFYKTHLAGYFDDYPLWIAHYNRKELDKKKHFNWVFWQHSEKGRLNGIKGNVDLNVFHGNMQELEDLCYYPEEE
jgi:lysozyme